MNERAVIAGFGVIFSDVDVLGSATLEFFDLGDNSLAFFSTGIRRRPAEREPANGSLGAAVSTGCGSHPKQR